MRSNSPVSRISTSALWKVFWPGAAGKSWKGSFRKHELVRALQLLFDEDSQEREHDPVRERYVGKRIRIAEQALEEGKATEAAWHPVAWTKCGLAKRAVVPQSGRSHGS